MIDYTFTAIRGLAFWQDWQSRVIDADEMFASSPVFVDQMSQTEEEYEETAAQVAKQATIFDPDGKVRDVPHGARFVDTQALGPVTRQWLDSNVEIDFLARHGVKNPCVLDIGAGYGRLAASYSPLCLTYTCTDAVAVSQDVCRYYLSKYAPWVSVVAPEELPKHKGKFDLAINIHSWNECYLMTVKAWILLLDRIECPRLFTVSHGQLADGSAYKCHEEVEVRFRDALLTRYNLVAEETLGMSSHPYALWEKK